MEVSEIANGALADGADPSGWLTFALEARDLQHAAEAQKLLDLIIANRSDYSPAYYELAFLFRLKGDHRKATSLLQTALKYDWPQFRTRLFLGHMLFAQGAHAEGATCLNEAIAGSHQDRRALDMMLAFGRYVERNPLGRTLVLSDRLRARHAWIDSAQLAKEILAAIGARRPFAFVRLGDGEGGVMTLNTQDEAAYRPIYDQNRDELIAMWFGKEFPWRTNGFFDLASQLVAHLHDADVVGVPYESWVEHEYRISSLRGIPSLTNVFHAMLAAPGRSALRICSQVAHVDLARSGDLARVIQQAKAISVISCMDGLGDMLRQRFGLADVAFYRIPGEQGSRSIIGQAASQGVHYPDRFNQLMAELATPHAGRVFLIAGGLLGKLYAMQIRRHGGIAVDIGSIVDSWMGYATRPGYEKPVGL